MATMRRILRHAAINNLLGLPWKPLVLVSHRTENISLPGSGPDPGTCVAGGVLQAPPGPPLPGCTGAAAAGATLSPLSLLKAPGRRAWPVSKEYMPLGSALSSAVP